MSKAIVLITPNMPLENINVSLAYLSEKYRILFEQDNFYLDDYIDNRNTDNTVNYVSISKSYTEVDDYGDRDDVPVEFKNKLSKSDFFVISFNDLQLVNEVIKTVLFKYQAEVKYFWFDNDYGDVIQGTVVMEELSKDPLWNWNIQCN